VRSMQGEKNEENPEKKRGQHGVGAPRIVNSANGGTAGDLFNAKMWKKMGSLSNSTSTIKLARKREKVFLD